MHAPFCPFPFFQPVLRRSVAFRTAIGLVAALFLGWLAPAQAGSRVEFHGGFAAVEGFVAAPEKPSRQDLCLNGRWQFQPIPVPADWKPGTGTPPPLPAPDPQRWEPTAIKIPSPWNVNGWGNGSDAGDGSRHPYLADSVYYPSYPSRWDGERMGWLRRTFRLPADMAGKRLRLRFEAVAGEAQVFVNGEPVGTHFDSFLPFDCDATGQIHAEGDNELLVGIRKSDLFNVVSPDYPADQTRTYPNGSDMDHLVGIWNDVFLVAVPETRVEDVFVRTNVDENTLALDLTLRNDGPQERKLRVGGQISPWINLAGTGVLEAPISKWRLDAPVLNVPGQEVTLPPGGTVHLARQVKVAEGLLKFWSPVEPNLYGLTLEVSGLDGAVLDRKYTRFGWRQFKLRGRDLLLNGKPLQLFGDFCHPFGPYIGSRRYVWADYRMIKDFGGNLVRPHAQPMPRFWLDLADEMGLCVLDESAIFGSSISLNLHEPVTWERLARHVDDLVLRDRNHPAVFGWSTANEMFALFLHTIPAEKEAGYPRLKALALRPRQLDKTRDWISVDGDKDLDGALPVWSGHHGIGVPQGDDLPEIDKPRMIGEHGGTYYAGPPRLSEIDGDRAFQNSAGRNEALAADLYRMVADCARPKLTAFSPSELVWFGLEHLPYGYQADTRPPGKADGVFFPDYTENAPGVQIERLPPYVATLNPGFDPALPLYKPLAMFGALKAALDPRGPQPCAWDHFPGPNPKLPVPAPTKKITRVGFVGDEKAALFNRLIRLGLTLTTGEEAGGCPLLIIDGENLGSNDSAHIRLIADTVTTSGGLVWIMAREGGAAFRQLDGILPGEVTLNARRASSLVHTTQDPAVDVFGLADLYFAEETPDPYIQKAGLDGPFVKTGRVLLAASGTDWSLFERQGESRKCSSVEIYEHLQKPAGTALVETPRGVGKLWISTLDITPETPTYDRFWKRLFVNLGVQTTEKGTEDQPDPETEHKKHDLLLDGPSQGKPGR